MAAGWRLTVIDDRKWMRKRETRTGSWKRKLAGPGKPKAEVNARSENPQARGESHELKASATM
jgi:hypothetical protein